MSDIKLDLTKFQEKEVDDDGKVIDKPVIPVEELSEQPVDETVDETVDKTVDEPIMVVPVRKSSWYCSFGCDTFTRFVYPSQDTRVMSYAPAGNAADTRAVCAAARF